MFHLYVPFLWVAMVYSMDSDYINTRSKKNHSMYSRPPSKRESMCTPSNTSKIVCSVQKRFRYDICINQPRRRVNSNKLSTRWRWVDYWALCRCKQGCVTNNYYMGLDYKTPSVSCCTACRARWVSLLRSLLRYTTKSVACYKYLPRCVFRSWYLNSNQIINTWFSFW